MKINEIERLPSNAAVKLPKRMSDFPVDKCVRITGSDFSYYKEPAVNGFKLHIIDFTNEVWASPTNGPHFEIVASAVLTSKFDERMVPSFPNLFSIELVRVKESMQSKGIGKIIYNTLLHELNVTLVTDVYQTPGGAKVWNWLSRNQDVEVLAYLHLLNDSAITDDMIDNIMELGGQYDDGFFFFDVDTGGDEAKFEIERAIKLYHAEDASDTKKYSTGMIAKSIK